MWYNGGNMKNILLKTKLRLQKILPKSLFRIIVSIFRFIKKPFFYIESNILFKNKKIIDVKYSNIDFKMVLDPSNGFLDRHINFYKLHEPEILDIYLKYIKPSDTVLDVGMNNGFHTLFLSKLVGENGKVYSFEPIKKLVNQVKESLDLNNINNVKLNNLALGNENENSIINIEEDHFGGSSILEKDSSTIISKKEEIEIKKLDSLDLPKIDFIKVDTEGYEYEFFKGGISTIEKYKPMLLFEFNPISYNSLKTGDAYNFLDHLQKLGYSLYDIEDLRKEIKNLKEYVFKFKKNIYEQQSNILAIYEKN